MEMSKTQDVPCDHSAVFAAAVTYLCEHHEAVRARIRAKNERRAQLKELLQCVRSIAPALTPEIDEMCASITVTPEPHVPSDDEVIQALKAAVALPESRRPSLARAECIDDLHMADIINGFRADDPPHRTVQTKSAAHWYHEYAKRYPETE